MLYIMAGVDGSGKSTCFELLKGALGNKAIFVKESYTESTEERYARVYKAAKLAASGKIVIYDRATVLDDLVYEPVLQHKQSVLHSSLRLRPMIEQILHDAKVLYFCCEDEALKTRLTERGDEYVTIDDLANIRAMYDEVFETYGIHPYVFNTTYTSATVVAARVLQIVYRKPFKLAHIVPQGSLSKIKDKGYLMCLANVVQEDSAYAEFYKNLTRDDRYILMDNGAAEGQQLSMKELVACYERIMPNEIVLPDTLCDCQGTLRKSSEAIVYLNDVYGMDKPFTFMGVPQGCNLREWRECMEEMLQWPEIHAIGVSKFLQMKMQDEMARYDAVAYLEDAIKEYRRFDIEVHLLGCSESPSTIAKIAKDFPFVRGCDSAYGYICTQADVRIYENTKRPAGEIDFVYGRDYDTLSDNLTALELAADVFDNSYDARWKQEVEECIE